MKSKHVTLAGWIKPFLDTKEVWEEVITKTGKTKLVSKITPKYRYCVAHGGRGGGKSYEIATLLVLLACQKKNTILCSRSLKGAIADSVHALLKIVIDNLELSNYFHITREKIICKINGSEFIFKGLLRNIDSLKSIPVINYVWLEEADNLTWNSWRTLKPTIRANNSQIFISMNPKNKTDCIYREFIADEAVKGDDAYVVYVHWSDNIYFNDILNNERLRDLNAGDMDLYQHIWEGALLEHSDAQIFKNKWVVEEFIEPENMYAYYGLDFGYSVDPTAAIRCYINDNNLYITHEFFKVGVEIDHIGQACERYIPGFKESRVVADNSRPETISFMRRQFYRVEGCDKGKGSIEDGIAFIRSFQKVIIHPRCTELIKEFTLYSYKIDPHSNDITTIIVDKHNHGIDALRYALERIMKKTSANYDILARL